MRVVAAAVGVAVLVVVTSALGAAGNVDVTIPGAYYEPARLDVLVGTTVTWRNADSTTHTVTADDDTFDSGFLPRGAAFARTFAASGTYAFHCTVHRFMKGVVHVLPVVFTGPEAPVPAGSRALLGGTAPTSTTELVLERRQAGRWERVTRIFPGPGGGYAVRVLAAEPATYRVRAGEASSQPLRVRVTPIVSLVRDGGRLLVTTRPARPGGKVLAQVYERERFAFRTVATGRLDRSGRAVLPSPSVPGGHVRVVVAALGGWSPGTSRVVVLPQPGP